MKGAANFIQGEDLQAKGYVSTYYSVTGTSITGNFIILSLLLILCIIFKVKLSNY